MLYRLLYFHDPMCSWCWAYRPLLTEILANLPEHVVIKRILGGLAPDTEEIMPLAMQQKIESIWHKIQLTVPGTEFNFGFWETCVPRRSTYPACRAVIASRLQAAQAEDAMILAIQRAYYLQARNPSDYATLFGLAEAIGLDPRQFAIDIHSLTVHQLLQDEIAFTHALQVKGFPSLIFERNGSYSAIQIDYSDAAMVISKILSLCA